MLCCCCCCCCSVVCVVALFNVIAAAAASNNDSCHNNFFDDCNLGRAAVESVRLRQIREGPLPGKDWIGPALTVPGTNVRLELDLGDDCFCFCCFFAVAAAAAAAANVGTLHEAGIVLVLAMLTCLCVLLDSFAAIVQVGAGRLV